jgi:hypothetical protein
LLKQPLHTPNLEIDKHGEIAMRRKGRVFHLFVLLCVFWSFYIPPYLVQAEVQSPANQPLFWNRECLTCEQPIWSNYRVSLDIDQQGYPHVVADIRNQNTNVYVIMNLYKDYLGWHSQVVDDDTDSGYSLYLQLDSFGYEHVLYGESDIYIKYAYRDHSGWHAQRIFSTADFGYPLTAHFIHVDSLGIDASNRPHATIEANINQGTSLVYYIHLTETGWQKEEIGEGDHAAVALDSSGTPHFAYVTRIWDGSTVVDRILSYAYRDGAGWHSEQVAHQVAPRVAIAMDRNGFPHIVSCDDYYVMEYHHKDENGWHRETLGGGSPQNPYIFLNSQGKPFIGFNDYGHISYAFLRQDGWWERGQTQNPFWLGSIGMAMDGDDRIHFAYRDASTFDVIYSSPYTGPIYSISMPIIRR